MNSNKNKKFALMMLGQASLFLASLSLPAFIDSTKVNSSPIKRPTPPPSPSTIRRNQSTSSSITSSPGSSGLNQLSSNSRLTNQNSSSLGAVGGNDDPRAPIPPLALNARTQTWWGIRDEFDKLFPSSSGGGRPQRPLFDDPPIDPPGGPTPMGIVVDAARETGYNLNGPFPYELWGDNRMALTINGTGGFRDQVRKILNGPNPRPIDRAVGRRLGIYPQEQYQPQNQQK